MANFDMVARLSARIGDFQRKMSRAAGAVNRLESETEKIEDLDLDVDTSGLHSSIKEAQIALEGLEDEEVEIEPSTGTFNAKIAAVKASLKSIPEFETVHFIAITNQFNRAIRGMQNDVRLFGTEAKNVIMGVAGTMLPALIPAAATAGAAIGGLASAFTSAGVGAVAFGSVAVTALGDVFEANDEIDKLREKLAETTDLEERAKLNKQIQQEVNKLSEEQQKALKSLQNFSDFWDEFAAKFQEPVLDIFNRSLQQLQKLLEALQPTFEASVKAVDNLSQSLGKALDTEPVQRFVEMLNNNAGPMLESFGKMAGNMFLGLINLLVAFEPIGQTVVDKMLELSESFAQWSSTLDENQAFQSFLDYVSANTPAVLSLISGLIDLIINVVTALAPLGSAVLNVADSFVQWINELIESNEWIVQVAGTAAVLASAFMAVAPIIILVSNVLGGLVSIIGVAVGVISKVVAGITTMAAGFGFLTGATSTVIGGIAALVTSFLSIATVSGVVVVAFGIMGEAFGEEIQNMVNTAIEKGPQIITNLANGIISKIPSLMATGTQVIVGFSAAIVANLPTIMQKGFQIIATLIQGLASNASALISAGLSVVITFVTSVIDSLPQVLIAGLQLLVAIVQGIMDNLPQILDGAVAIVVSLKDFIVQMAPALLTAAGELIGTIIGGIIKNLPQILTAGVQIILTLIKGLFELDGALQEAADGLMRKLGQSIKDAIPGSLGEAWTMIQDGFGNMWNKITGQGAENSEVTKQQFRDTGSSAVNSTNSMSSGVLSNFNLTESGALSSTGSLASGVQNNFSQTELGALNSSSSIAESVKSNFGQAENSATESTGQMQSLTTSNVEKMQEQINNSTESIDTKTVQDFMNASQKASSETSSMNAETTADVSSMEEQINQAMEGLNTSTVDEFTGMNQESTSETSSMNTEVISKMKDMSTQTNQAVIKLTKDTVTGFQQMQTTTTSMTQQMTGTIMNHMNQLLSSWGSSMNNMRSIANSTASSITSIFSSLASRMTSLGSQAGAGFRNGLAGQRGGIIGQAQSIAGAVTSTISSALSIHSPSRVLEDMGSDTGEGYANGVEDWITQVKGISTDLADAVLSGGNSLAMSSPQINETVEHRLSDNLQSKQPQYVTLNLGGRNYRAFVEDIDNGQGAMADLDAEF